MHGRTGVNLTWCGDLTGGRPGKKKEGMKYFVLWIWYFVIMFSTPVMPLHASDKTVFFREEFETIENWRPLTFPKIKEHTRYTILRDGSNGYLRAESNASASGLVHREAFDVYKFPRVRWRWKIGNVYKTTSPGKKSGDDYPIRIYILFKYDPDQAPVFKKLRYGLAKALYGEYPPDSSLNYVWASSSGAERIFTNPYADEARMIVLQAGPSGAGDWVEEEVNVIEDYRKAFGVDPPPMAALAIMNDSDNTKESSVSYLDYIEVFSTGR